MSKLENNTASLQAMAEKINGVSNEVNTQSNLIARVKEAIQGKVANTGVDLPELSNPASQSDILFEKEFIDEEGNKKIGKLKPLVDLGYNGAGYPSLYEVEIEQSSGGIGYGDWSYLKLLDKNFGTANSNHVLEDFTFSTSEYYLGSSSSAVGPHFGKAVSGTMPNNGNTSQTIDGLEIKSVTIPEGYTAGGIVTVDDTIDNIADTQADLLSQIQSELDGKSVPGGGMSVDTCTVRLFSTLSGMDLREYAYQSYENGEISAHFIYVGGEAGAFDITINNVVCNSIFAVAASSLNGVLYESEGISGWFGGNSANYIFVDAANGSTVSIELLDDD